ncbi:MAG: aminotransferase class V-fold PLP-dependent enzyme [Rhabdochlamydiaceae bacterium]|nr:aminotransferase class V-fold PLP-dependent enzyme [Rhabdochlamydiaceae bacterium]
MDSLYLDNHAATRSFPEVLEHFFRLSKEYWASPSSPHFLGQQQMYPLQKSVECFFQELGAGDRDELYFTESGKDAIDQVFWMSYLHRARESGKTLFLLAQTEEKAFITACKELEALGCSYKLLPVNSKGQITPEALEAAINPRTALVSLSWAHGLTGVLHPIADLVEVCRKKDVLFHVDASYVLGKNFFRFQDLGIDFFSLDGALIHALKDVGLLLVKEGFPSFEKERGESIAKISAFSKAVGMMQEKFEHYCMEIARLRDLLEKKISSACLDAVVLFKDADRLPTCSVIAFPPLSSESLLFLLNTKGIYASCGGGKFPPLSEVLTASNYCPSIARSALSFCLSYDMTEQDVNRIVEGVLECVTILKKSAGELNPYA